MDIGKIQKLREKTAASYAECKRALQINDDINEAEKIIRQKGLAVVDSNSIFRIDEGAIYSYVHSGNRIGVLVEVKCKTDFVAKTDEFTNFAKEVALQVAAMKPKYISRADVPLDAISQEVGFRKERLAGEGITEHSENFQKILDAEMDHWYAEVCLLEQTYVRDGKKTVKDLLADLIAKVDETCRVSRFERWEIGEEEQEQEQEEQEEDLEIESSLKSYALIVLFTIFACLLTLILV